MVFSCVVMFLFLIPVFMLLPFPDCLHLPFIPDQTPVSTHSSVLNPCLNYMCFPLDSTLCYRVILFIWTIDQPIKAFVRKRFADAHHTGKRLQN